MKRQAEYVWVIEEGVRAELIQLGAHFSVIKYTLNGTVYEVIADNNEFEHIGDREIDDDPEG